MDWRELDQALTRIPSDISEAIDARLGRESKSIRINRPGQVRAPPKCPRL
jgi:hypothetical protein